jgi:hypothetical protein
MTHLEQLGFLQSSQEAAQLKLGTILWFTLFLEKLLSKSVRTISKQLRHLKTLNIISKKATTNSWICPATCALNMIT